MAAPNWKGLLNWSIKHQTGPPAEGVRQLSDEDKRWLEEALTSASVNIGQQMRSMKTVLDSDAADSKEDVEQKEIILDSLLEIVDNIDYARGGMQTLLKLLRSPHASLRWRAAEVIATSVQLNEPVQKEYLEADSVNKLLHLAEDADPTCRQKSLLALSCLIRQNSRGLSEFLQSHGVDKLIHILQSDEARNQRKAVQLLAYIASEQPDRIPVSQVASETPKLLDAETADLRESTIRLVTTLSADPGSLAYLSQDKLLLRAVEDRLRRLGALKQPEEVEDAADEAAALSNLEKVLSGSSRHLQNQTADAVRRERPTDTQPASQPLLLM